MRLFNRRAVVLGTGGAGLAALGPTARAATPAAAVSDSLRLTGRAEAEFLARLGRPPERPTPRPDTSRPERAVEAAVVERAGPDGRPFAYGLAFDCDPRVVNWFRVGGRPLAARRVCFTADRIGWTPGAGGPVYAAYRPRYEYAAGAAYPAAKWHQLVPLIGGGYFTGSQADDVVEADEPGPVGFDVNDSHHEDNAGGYRVVVWSWS